MTTTPTTRARGALLAIAALALAAIAVAVPALSSAHGGHGHGGRHHADVGTIKSFDPATGLLVITPTSGDDVSGTVDDRTKIKCEDEDDDNQADDQNDDNGDDGSGHDADDDNGDGHGGHGQGKRDRGGHRGNCSPDALVAGATVEEAELEITATGLVFEEVELR